MCIANGRGPDKRQTFRARRPGPERPPGGPPPLAHGGRRRRGPAAYDEKMGAMPGFYLALESLPSTSSQSTTFHHADM